MLEVTVQKWLAVPKISRIILVRGPVDWYQPPKGVSVVVNERPEDGMGSSLRVGAQAVGPEATAVVMGLGDMPEIQSQTIGSLISLWERLGDGHDGEIKKNKAIVAPQINGRRGHPVLFGAQYIAQLHRCGGDMGARDLLRQAANDVVLMPTDDGGTLIDVDTMDDWEKRL